MRVIIIDLNQRTVTLLSWEYIERRYKNYKNISNDVIENYYNAFYYEIPIIIIINVRYKKLLSDYMI